MLKIVAFAAVALMAESPGGLLTPGMQLVYSSGDQESPPVTVVSVSDTTIGALTSCRTIALNTGSGAPIEHRKWCIDADVLLAWDTVARALRPIRPVGEGMNLVVPGPSGRRSAFATRSPLEQTVSGIRVNVVETVVVTRDSAGRQVQRLREFFSPGLATATAGVFEVPDSTQRGGWRMQSSFKLVRITR